ncbi:exonuclease 3'-5' domain-containing protein 2 [Condylostylus longicornis]|uniref:exonuclease 3'-5' domain-containing protein 2 n=1 Tax=Condylostylus longicornis TaxID=2530218 RepID=UPI00244DD55A|nr:exonuclease 3'-5' domain-containing protein 2 [Condylostylus longicornis]
MVTSSIQKRNVSNAILAGAGIGFVYFLFRKRSLIINSIRKACKFGGPLRNKKVEIVEDADHCNRIAVNLKNDCEQFRVLGFDCEWVNVGGSRRPVALLQLASHSGLCALIRLCKLKHIPMKLREILEDDNILKVGIIPSEDAMKLSQDYGVGVSNTIDLRFLALRASRKPEGMANMAKSILDLELDKDWRVSCSNWEAHSLTERQINYAANDALVAMEVYKVYFKEIMGIYWFRKKTHDEFLTSIEPFIDMKYKDSYSSNISKMSFLSNFGESKKKNNKVIKRTYTTLARTKALYDNCLMQAPDGDLLCTCERRKAQWYLDQNLADLIEEDPFTIRLNFEPAGRAVGDVGKYYQIPKENRCVVCGSEDGFIRKNIVPREYRKHFPDVMKSHTSHDVLLLCPNCHQVSNISDLKVRENLAKSCEAPLLFHQGGAKFVENPKLKKIRSAARALLYNASKIPLERREQLKQVLLDNFPEKSEINSDLLEYAANVEVLESVENYCCHGIKVVNKYQDEFGGLIELEKLWRKHFLNTMKPKFMPEFWSINHNEDRLEIRAKEGRIKENDMIIAGIDPNFIKATEDSNEEEKSQA